MIQMRGSFSMNFRTLVLLTAGAGLATGHTAQSRELCEILLRAAKNEARFLGQAIREYGPYKFVSVSEVEGRKLVGALEKSNREICKSSDAKGLARDGYIRIDDRVVYQLRDGKDDLERPLPFQIVRLPFAQTGMYVPKDLKFDGTDSLTTYDGVIILLPGIGTDGSNARTLFNIGQTFMEGKNPALNLGTERDPRKLRLLPVLLDISTNGLGAEANSTFVSPAGTVAVIRHAHLILKTVFPTAQFTVAGRSHGGLSALEYGNSFSDVRAIIAVNPSPSDRTMHWRAVETSEANVANIPVDGRPVVLNGSWQAHREHVPDYSALQIDFLERFFGAKNQGVPTLIMMGKNDPSYPQPDYVNYVTLAVARLPNVKMSIVDVPAERSHDLWSRQDKGQFRDVVHQIVEFVDSPPVSAVR